MIMFAKHVRFRLLLAHLIGAGLTLAACTIDESSVESPLLVPTYDTPSPTPTTPCGEEGGPGCEVGWCMDAAGICPSEFVATCDPLFLTISCQSPTFEPTEPVITEPPTVEPTEPVVTEPIGTTQTTDGTSLARYQQLDPGNHAIVDVNMNPAASPDMTGWYADLGTKGKVNIKTPDGSLDAQYTVVTSDKGTLELKVTGGGFTADFDPRDPLVIKLYDEKGTMKYSSTGTLRVIIKGNVSLKNGPEDVEVSKKDDVVSIKKGDDTITIKKNGAKSMKLEGNVGGKDVTIVFKQ
jgi:hypothetical protein